MLGQSFGGLCVFSYLSFAPEGLREAFVTGGVPGIGVPIDDVYRATYERMIERNRRYYARFPRRSRARCGRWWRGWSARTSGCPTATG